MTTIAATRTEMCSDSQATSSEGTKFSCVKIFRKKGAIIGFCGSLAEGTKFVQAFPDLDEDFDLEDFEAIVLNSKGIWRYEGGSMVPMKVDQGFYAIGSGSMAALGALHAGTSPQQAIRIASKVDCYTGGRVRTMKL